MAGKNAFRQTFRLSSPINWCAFNKNNNLMQSMLDFEDMDCIMEVHDARVPFTGRNASFYRCVSKDGSKPHILVLNKRDLTYTCDQIDIQRHFKHFDNDCRLAFTNAQQINCTGIEWLISLTKHVVCHSIKTKNEEPKKEYNVLVSGLPTVGKTTLIKALHQKLRDMQTLSVQKIIDQFITNGIRISDDPKIFLCPKPTILTPIIHDDETGMKLALVGCISDSVVSDLSAADYLLFWLNKHKIFEYVEAMHLTEPCDDINEVLETYGQHLLAENESEQTKADIDNETTAKLFIDMFRSGKLGPINLDLTSYHM